MQIFTLPIFKTTLYRLNNLHSPFFQKSKCCCVYKKPLKFGESESEDSDSDCEHCSHHTPKDFVAARDGEGNRRDDETNESKNDGGGGCNGVGSGH